MIQKNWEELIKPNKLVVNAGHDPRRIATMVAGITFGFVPTFFPDCNTGTLKGATDNLRQAVLANKISEISTYVFLGGLSTFLVGEYVLKI